MSATLRKVIADTQLAYRDRALRIRLWLTDDRAAIRGRNLADWARIWFPAFAFGIYAPGLFELWSRGNYFLVLFAIPFSVLWVAVGYFQVKDLKRDVASRTVNVSLDQLKKEADLTKHLPRKKS